MPINGADLCRHHIGQGKAKASERIAEDRARRTLAALHKIAPVTDPFGELERLAGDAVALVEALRPMVADLEAIRYRGGPGSGTEQIRGELSAFVSALGRAESILGRIVSLDLEGRRVRLQEAQVAAVVVALDQVLASTALGLDGEQQRMGRELLARLLSPGATSTTASAVTGSELERSSQ